LQSFFAANNTKIPGRVKTVLHLGRFFIYSLAAGIPAAVRGPFFESQNSQISVAKTFQYLTCCITRNETNCNAAPACEV
jgi:hypothetical protein